MKKMNIRSLLAYSIVFVLVSLTVSCDSTTSKVNAAPTASTVNVSKIAPYSKEIITDSGTNGASTKIILIEKVMCVFMHKPGKFTYWYSVPNSTNNLFSFTIESDLFNIVLDAEKDKSWVKYCGNSQSPDRTCYYQEIHLDSISTVKGAGPIQ